MSIKSMRAAIAADIPVILWGDPGVGKTAAIRAAAEKEGVHLETVIASAYDPGEILGYLVQHEGNLMHAPAPWIKRLVKALEENPKKGAWLYLDEFSCAPASVQAVLLRVVHERRAHDIDLTGVRIVASANPPDSAAAEGWLAPATANRWTHIDFKPSPAGWVQGEMNGWGLGGTAASAFIASWIRHRPSILIHMPEKEAEKERGWPSPRSWSHLSRALHQLGGRPEKALVTESGQTLSIGLVGAGATGEITTWAQSLDLPDPEDLLTGKAALPGRGDQAHAALLSMVSASLQKNPNQQQRIEMAWKVLAKVRKDLAVTAAAALLDGDPLGQVPKEAEKLGSAICKVRDSM